MSWNGATEVAHWELRIGESRASLRPWQTVPKRGFETQFIVPKGTAFAVAVALDRGRKPLARSNTVRI